MDNTSRDYRDLIAGGLLIVLGVVSAQYSAANYNLGEIARMGPGMFPTALGYILAGLGVLIALPAWFRRGTLPIPEFKPMFLVLAAVLSFAMLIEFVGMIPTVYVVTGLAVLADNKMGLRGTLILGSLLAVSTWLIFRVGLGIQMQPFVWPF